MGRAISGACTTQGTGAFTFYVWCAVGSARLLRQHRCSSGRQATAPVRLRRGNAGRHRSPRDEQSRSCGMVAREHAPLVAENALLRVPARCWSCQRDWTWGLNARDICVRALFTQSFFLLLLATVAAAEAPATRQSGFTRLTVAN